MCDLNEKELLEVITEWKDLYDTKFPGYIGQDVNEQAYVQLRKIVEEHFSATEQVVDSITKQMIEGALASKEMADQEQGVDEDCRCYNSCPSCGREWDMKKHNACQCGAILTRQPVQVDEEELKEWAYHVLTNIKYGHDGKDLSYLIKRAEELLTKKPGAKE